MELCTILFIFTAAPPKPIISPQNVFVNNLDYLQFKWKLSYKDVGYRTNYSAYYMSLDYAMFEKLLQNNTG